MKCDICDQEFANSEEIKRHKEQVHPMGDGDGEKPDLMEEPVEGEMPEPAERLSR
ncbi:MAG TPA: C2H2-type zinc finger protein [Verrucomicrobiae bacterium]|nr:C2H2-type zinc finger protein [Verrucomicrobiae bacterium]